MAAVLILSALSRSPAVATEPAVRVLTGQDLSRSGLASVGDVLQRQPWATSARNAVTFSDGDGALLDHSTALAVRGLGPEHLLIRLDGQPLPTLLDGAVDLNMIPIGLVERIEYRPSASTAAGEGGLAGLVDIITRRDVQGSEIGAFYSQWDEGDGETRQADLTAGLSQGNRSLRLHLAHFERDAIQARDRRISAEPVFGTGLARGSAATPQGRFWFLDEDNAFRDWHLIEGSPAFSEVANDFRDFRDSDRYNFAAEQQLLSPESRFSIHAGLDQALSEGITLTINAFHARKRATREHTPNDLFLGAFGQPGFDTITISEDNHFNPFGFDFDPSENLVSLARRLTEAGNRRHHSSENSLRLQAVLSGDVSLNDRPWHWQLSVMHADREGNDRFRGYVDSDRLRQGLGPSFIDQDDQARCGDPSELLLDCVPINLFGGQGEDGSGTIDQEQLDFLLTSGAAMNRTTLNEWRFDIEGHAFSLPAGEVALTAGLLGRDTRYTQSMQGSPNSDLPDVRELAGTYRSDGVYLNARMPLLRHRWMMDMLELDVGVRHRDFDVFNGGTTLSTGLAWQPVSELQIHYRRDQALRVPSALQAFESTSSSLMVSFDPCSGVESGVSDPGIIERCQRDGIPPDGIFLPPVRADVLMGGAVSGGRTLNPEKSTLERIGVSWAPEALPGFHASLDVWSQEIEDFIRAPFFQEALVGCYWEGVETLCDRVTRNGFDTSVDLVPINDSRGASFRGMDLGLAYSGIPFPWGELDLHLDASRLSSVRLPTYDEDARALSQPNLSGTNRVNQAVPEWRADLTLDWRRDAWRFRWSMRFIDSMREPCQELTGATSVLLIDLGLCNDIERDEDGAIVPGGDHRNRIGSLTYHDVQLAYRFGHGGELAGGVSNLFDKAAQFSAATAAHSFDATIHEIPGRRLHVQYRQRF